MHACMHACIMSMLSDGSVAVQVLMDVLGVAITCVVCNVVLHPAMAASHQHGANAALLPSAIMLNATTA